MNFKWMFLCFTATIICCYSCTIENGNNDDVNHPAIPDPEGTVALDMTASNVRIDGTINLTEGNFGGALFTTVGKVRGLGDVNTIPKKGWVNRIAAIEGHGYVAYYNNQYYRLFVSSYNSLDERIIVKHQRPFTGSEKEIKLKASTVTIDGNASNNQIVEFANESLFPYTVTVPQTVNWCTAYVASSDNAMPPDIIRIAVNEKNPTLAARECTITVASDIGKEASLKVVQAGGESWITVDYYNQLYLYNNTQTVQVKSNDQWTATSNAAWCTVSPNSGKENGTITVSATANPTGSNRNAVITLATKDNKAKAEINVVQPASNLSVSRNSLSFAAPASQNTFTVSSNASWTVKSDKDWCTATVNNQTVTVSVTENLTGADRNATITVAVSDELKAEVSITQTKPTLSASKTNISFTGSQSNDSFTVTSSSSAWTVSSNQPWCTVAKNNNQVAVSASENLSGAVRTATVKIALSAQHYTTVEVTQAVPTLAVSKTALSFPKTPTNNETITVTSNVSSWNVNSNSSWCTVEKSGNNIIVSASQNTTGNVRETTVMVSIAGNVQTITVSQGFWGVGDYYNLK